MGKRIADLEDALAAVQALVSNDKHPLLSDEYMILKAPISTANVASAMDETCDSIGAALGTLTLGDRAKFVGPTADADVRTAPGRLLNVCLPDAVSPRARHPRLFHSRCSRCLHLG